MPGPRGRRLRADKAGEQVVKGGDPAAGAVGYHLCDGGFAAAHAFQGVGER